MPQKPAIPSDLTPYYTKALFMQRTARQLEKDFNAAGIELAIAPSESTSLDALVAVIAPVVQQLMRQSFEQLMALLYRIDVPEKAVARATTAGQALAESVAKLIIERELKKVLVREWMAQQ